MKEYFCKNGLFVLGFNPDDYPFDMPQAHVEVCYTTEGEKFYNLKPIQDAGNVYITDDIVEPIYGCTLVDYRPATSDKDTPVYMVYLSREMALLKRGAEPNERYWIIIKGDIAAEVPKELLLYHNLIPGVSLETDMVAEPPPIPEDIKQKLFDILCGK
jgi:hypothetical protein